MIEPERQTKQAAIVESICGLENAVCSLEALEINLGLFLTECPDGIKSLASRINNVRSKIETTLY